MTESARYYDVRKLGNIGHEPAGFIWAIGQGDSHLRLMHTNQQQQSFNNVAELMQGVWQAAFHRRFGHFAKPDRLVKTDLMFVTAQTALATLATISFTQAFDVSISNENLSTLDKRVTNIFIYNNL